MDPTIKSKKKLAVRPNRTFLMTTGISAIVVAVVVLSLSLYESFGGGLNVQVVEVPGFHELKLNTPGMYAGLYQHRGAEPMPANELSKIEVHVLSKDDFREIPVISNTSGQTFRQLGMSGMPLFNFFIEEPGEYTLSGVYPEGVKGPVVQVLLFPQSVQNVKQTIISGVAFFVLFLCGGIFILLRLNRWAPAGGAASKSVAP